MTQHSCRARPRRGHALAAAAALLTASTAGAGPTVVLGHHAPCNLFTADAPVRLEATLKGFPAGGGQATAAISNYFGDVWTIAVPVKVEAGRSADLPLDLGLLPPGYYDVTLSATVLGADGKAAAGRSASASLGVVRFVHRSAQEALHEGSRFGLKLFQIGTPGIWWRRPLQWPLAEVVDACAGLGLQWTRALFDQGPSEEPGVIGTTDLITNHAMNVVLKIEGFPASCYDAQRYGPVETWKQNHKKKAWSRCTVPLKVPYQQWLRDEIGKIPPSQNVFEIGNEVWDYMSAEEFAEWCQQIVPVVRALRPGAVVGADPGSVAFADRFFAAGGMNGMNAAFIHPYSFTPLPEDRIRPWLRNVHDIFRERLGRDLPLYVTEYGWSTAPQNPKYGKTERQQAQRTVRESLMLYAEDCKTLIPHWMADREQDPKEREHWFGFFRLAAQPKPVLVAHAVSARMIDGSRFVGDLWFGPGVGAMLFERRGVHTLALWTLDEAPGTGRKLEIDVGTNRVMVVDLMGREQPAGAPGGKLALQASADMTYVVGVSPALAKRAVGPEQDLVDGRWNTRSGSLPLPAVLSPPAIDGRLDEWTGTPGIALLPDFPSPGAATGTAYLAWDTGTVYVAVCVSDPVVTNAFDPATVGTLDKRGRPRPLAIANGDAFEISLCTRPSRQPQMSGAGQWYDYALTVAPTSAAGRACLVMTSVRWDKPVVNPPAADPSGLRWAAVVTNGGWTAEVAIPITLLKGFPAPQAGAVLSGRVCLTDADGQSAPRRMAVPATDEPMAWSRLILGSGDRTQRSAAGKACVDR